MNVRPVTMFIQERRIKKKQSNRWVFSKYKMVPSGEWEIIFTYDRGPLTFSRTTTILFSSEKEARDVFDRVFAQVFLKKKNLPNHKLPKTKTKKCHLSLVKDKL